MTRKRDPIHRYELADGRVRYKFTIDIGERRDGKRQQTTFRFDSLKEARAERSRIISERAKGTYVRPSKDTVGQLVDEWLSGKRNLGVGTTRTYTDSLRHVQEHIGHVPAQRLTKADVDAMVSTLMKPGTRLGRRRATPMAPRTVNNVLELLSAVLTDAVRQGKLVRNVAELVERPRRTRPEMNTWTAESAAAFLDFVADDRLAVAWMLSLYGLRRGEVLGLRWSDVDLVGKTITVQWNRVEVAGVVVEKEPKTERSKRTLPLDDGLVAALTAFQLKQREEHDAAGSAYARPCRLVDATTGKVCTGDHVVVDEIGAPFKPSWFKRLFLGLLSRSGLPEIRYHDMRHTCGTLMHLRGVPTAVISKWLGHASAAFTLTTYVHSQDEALAAAGSTLARAYGGDRPAPASTAG